VPNAKFRSRELRAEHKLRASENMAVRRIFGPKRVKNQKLQNFNSSLNII
jgi:hypothetical protein